MLYYHFDNENECAGHINDLNPRAVHIAGLKEDDHGVEQYDGKDEILVKKEVFYMFHNKVIIDVQKCEGYFVSAASIVQRYGKNMIFNAIRQNLAYIFD